ncbi:hypothetical protein [Croceitalea rosinachiae]|uniref:Phospholipase_D-nuclease N-terminal n=1 Tax=Croceitalea rosinachiae TaxID=3075596 RepID=A0ABU3A6B2_9FLAO|nr:hypothetical protein [Croceitalea sp. F388]MDT0605445.1 hypothetical protein [Croceitalea sp. F388]
MESIIIIFLMVFTIYAIIGLLFGLYFVFVGAVKIDPLLKDSKKKVRLLLLPGTIATWPFLIGKLFKSK